MKILLVADVPNWAFDRDADAIIKYLPQYDIFKTYTGRFNSNLFNKYDHIHFMNWLEGRSHANKVSGGVSSHNFELLHKYDAMKMFPKYQALIATSKFLYDKIKNKNKHVFYAPGGVHEDMFVPLPKNRTKTFVVGWVGQKTTGGLNLHESDKIDIKGYNLILKPLMNRLERYPDIQFKIHNKNYKNAIPYKKMPEIYKNIDCQICTSIAEGAPNPMFEAASCGKALISTKVGAISECIKEGYNGFLIDAYSHRNELDKTISSFEHYILKLKNNRELCDIMGVRSRNIIVKDWGWKNTVQRWIPMFEYLRKRKSC